jgi:hypothetical protein
MKNFIKNRFSLKLVVLMLTIAFVGISVNSYAITITNVTIPNTFTSGTTISSSQVNANFTAIANQMPAVKQSLSGIWITIPAAADQLSSISFTAPGTGYAMIFATGSISLDTAASTASYVCIDLADTSAYVGGCQPALGSDTAVRSFLPATFPDTGAGGYDIPYSIIKVIPVTSGVTYTYYLNGYATGMTAASLFQPNMTVLFVPNLLP